MKSEAGKDHDEERGFIEIPLNNSDHSPGASSLAVNGNENRNQDGENDVGDGSERSKTPEHTISNEPRSDSEEVVRQTELNDELKAVSDEQLKELLHAREQKLLDFSRQVVALKEKNEMLMRWEWEKGKRKSLKPFLQRINAEEQATRGNRDE